MSDHIPTDSRIHYKACGCRIEYGEGGFVRLAQCNRHKSEMFAAQAEMLEQCADEECGTERMESLGYAQAARGAAAHFAKLASLLVNMLLFAVALSLAGCGGGGGGGGTGPTPPPAGSFLLTARVYQYATTGGTLAFPGGTWSVNQSTGYVMPGTVVHLTATPAAGYAVLKWDQSDDDLSSSTANTITMPAADHLVQVQYAAPSLPFGAG